ncbi:protein artemis-like [Pecten maximus]|uniref:protein artemis-like n=1 Tax=Pecten maximus TaxID=6579 RepID=UPI0014588D76|nr:protein artemis-like [Pecten maximus]
MSCFKGRMSEYRNISLDRFDGPNLNSTVYFLSHLHEDHTVGLSVSSFITRLKESTEVYLYCSDVTKVLLIESPKYQHLERYIKTLPINQPVTVSIPQTSSCKVDFVQVTLLPAAHCPGSVMFLFEGSEGTALYTGDFRWEANHVSKVTALHSGERVKPIQSLYVDTTFCHPDCFHIPSRQDCVEAVSGLVKEWIAKGQGHVVHFTPRSHYGHEHLLKEISSRTSRKVHVSKAKVKIYEQISDLRNIFTADPEETPIHACLGERFARGDHDSLPCGFQPPKHSKLNKMVILPSTMYFTKKMRLNLTHIVERTRGIYRVCYSFHSSYNEVRNLVTYLKPGNVRPNVKPEPDPSLSEVQKRLNHFLKLDHIEQKYETVGKIFGTLKKKKQKRKYTGYTNMCSSDSDDLVFGSPDLKRMRSEEGNVTPVKNQGEAGPARDKEQVPSVSPQEAVTPMKSDISDVHSSYAGSNHGDSEMSGTGLLCDSDDDQEEISGFQGDELSTPAQSLLDAIDSQSASQEVKSFRVTFLEDEEQTVGQQAWESPDVPDFGEEETETQTREESVGDLNNDMADTDIVGVKSSQNQETSSREVLADSDESLKCQGYQGDIDSSQEQTDTRQMVLGEETGDLESAGSYSKETGDLESARNYSKETGDLESAGNYSKETGDLESAGNYSKETGDLESARNYSKETGDLESAGNYSKETGDLESAGNYSKETGDLESAGNYSKEDIAEEAKGGQDKEVNPVSQSDIIPKDELLEENLHTVSGRTESVNAATDANLGFIMDHNDECSRNKIVKEDCSGNSKNKIVNTSEDCSGTTSLTMIQSKSSVSTSHSKEWKKNGSYDLFEDSNDEFTVDDMEGGQCQIVPVSSVHETSGKDRDFIKGSQKSDSLDCKINEITSFKDELKTKISTEEQGCEMDSEKRDLSLEKSEGFEITDLTESYDEQCCEGETRDVEMVSHVCHTGDDQKHPRMYNVHRLSSCDTPGTSRSVCRCVLDASPQPDTILVEIQEDNESKQGIKQNRQLNKQSPQKPASKLLTNIQTNDLVIAILDSDSESDNQDSGVHKMGVTSVHGYESDSDITLPPSQEVNKLKHFSEVCHLPGSKDEVVMIIDDNSEDESDDSTSVSSSSSDDSDESPRKVSPRSRLDIIQRALHVRNNEKVTGDIIGYLGSNVDNDKISDVSDKLSDDSDFGVIDLTQSDSEEDTREIS